MGDFVNSSYFRDSGVFVPCRNRKRRGFLEGGLYKKIYASIGCGTLGVPNGLLAQKCFLARNGGRGRGVCNLSLRKS